jgi:amidophosphoribosyltransferase
VHLRISSPPTTHPCFYGIDTPTRSELIASSHTPDEIARYVTCNSLKYLTREGMMEAVDEATPEAERKKLRVIGEGYCDACFTGNYPVQFAPGEISSLRRVIN